MNILRVLPTRRHSQRHPQHRLADQPKHLGWEGTEDQVRLLGGPDLLAEDAPPTTKPLRGHPARTRHTCPLDQCTWPDTDLVGVDPYGRLLEHIRGHASEDVDNTIWRLEQAIERLQEDRP